MRPASVHHAGRGARGVALLEAVIALPLFVALMAALFYATALYLQQLSARGEARRAAWSHALSGCRVPTPFARARIDTAAVAASAVRLPSETRGYASAAGGGEMDGAISETQVEIKRRLRGEWLLGLSPTHLQADVRLPCNEAPQAGGLMSALWYGWAAVRFW